MSKRDKHMERRERIAWAGFLLMATFVLLGIGREESSPEIEQLESRVARLEDLEQSAEGIHGAQLRIDQDLKARTARLEAEVDELQRESEYLEVRRGFENSDRKATSDLLAIMNKQIDVLTEDITSLREKVERTY